ncbi:hypothetical protein [Archaeoglobus veneficus]|uniref:Uncharacterized protein n=1 Tax=Archaeoglobus veneficus (strain DSM 11195 / SNP6) TaxID=693661 RepID=F2KN23_ARCVS|nr:hypothetical protein [Archaeoglobus veneficus]AEA47299.1 hypothetical protein Arcve_1293 [Archaeoglobus veneficus SNP6]
MDFEEIIAEIIEEEDDEFEGDEEAKLAEIYRLASRLVKLLEELKSYELREAASLMLIKEIVRDDRILVGLATKMLQDMSFGFDEDEKYVS